MNLDFSFSIKVFAALFAIMNPIANIPVFLSLTEGAADTVRRKVALTAAIGVTIGCIVSAVAGGAILRAFGLTIDDFRLAGGLLVLLIALSMLHGAPSRQHSPGDDEGADPAAADSIAIYPLTIPLLVGPGTIATMIVLGHTAFSSGQTLAFALGLVAFLVLLSAALFAAPFIGRYLSPRVTAVTQRLMGMILAAIAMQMIVASLKAAFGLTH
ncbi:MarC family protein [Burkholderia sp. Bp9031]|uniref:MarC family protein n=1 Tax=Burkholderia sp. Bp9031 TaxID=2184566 RepID=UPI000F5F3897|nr:NAAT family transporter [Burkholderia sp. Bp9031]RQZ10519.1 MarC family protein [Burkholderia sp. Bp9031]